METKAEYTTANMPTNNGTNYTTANTPINGGWTVTPIVIVSREEWEIIQARLRLLDTLERLILNSNVDLPY